MLLSPKGTCISRISDSKALFRCDNFSSAMHSSKSEIHALGLGTLSEIADGGEGLYRSRLERFRGVTRPAFSTLSLMEAKANISESFWLLPHQILLRRGSRATASIHGTFGSRRRCQLAKTEFL